MVVIFLDEEDHLAEAIESVFAQTWTDWELILVDDGSTDRSSRIARQWADDHPEKVRYLTHPDRENRGMSESRNVGVGAARGTYVSYLDGDDVWLPEKLTRQLQLLKEHREARLVYGPLHRWFSWTGDPADADRDDLYGIHGDGITLTVDRLYEAPELLALFIEHKDLVPGPSVLFERALFHEVGGAEPDFRDRYEDAVVLAKMCVRASAYCAADSWYLYRQDPDRQWNADQQAQDRLRFVNWTADYLHREGIDEPMLNRAVARARRQINRPRRHQLYRLLRRTGRVALRMLSWPPSLRAPTSISGEATYPLARAGHGKGESQGARRRH